MKPWIIRKPPMVRAMREAHFSPGAVTATLITHGIWIVFSLLREIPAGIIDLANYLQKSFARYTYATAPGTMLLSLLLDSLLFWLVVLYVRGVESRPLSTIGISKERALRRFGAGTLIGLPLIAAWSLLPLLTWQFQYSGFKPILLLFIPAYIAQAAAEESLFRGYLLSSLTHKAGALPAVLISSAVFALLYAGLDGVSLAMLFLLSVLAALLTLRAGSLWAACGMRAAWGFAAGVIFPVSSGRLRTSYALFKLTRPAPGAESWGIQEALPALVLALALIALVLFAGKNRLVVRPTEAEQMYFRALRIARTALKSVTDEFGKPYIRRSVGLSRAMEGDAAGAAVLLADACGAGGVHRDSLTGFSADILRITDALLRRDETDWEYAARLKADPEAFAVWKTRREFEEKLQTERRRWNQRKSQSAPAQPDAVFCPMLRADIRAEDCADIAARVDSYADDEAHAPLRRMDRSLCLRCPRRPR